MNRNESPLQLGDPTPKRGTRRQKIAAISLMLALVLATFGALCAASYRAGRSIESDLRFLEPRRAPTLDEALIAYPTEYALRSNEKNDVIFLGDSTCRCGADPARFEQLTGLRAYNLGSQGNAGPKGFLITAKAYLLHHPPPQIVVLCLSPVAFDVGAAEMGRRLPSPIPTRFEANYGPEVPGVVPLEESLRYFIKRGSLSLWSETISPAPVSKDVRDLPLSGLETETFRTAQPKIHGIRGFCVISGVHGKRLDVESPGEPVRIADEWDQSVRKLAESCESSGVPLLIRFSPMPSNLSHVKDFSPIERWSQALRSSYPKVTIGRPELLWYEWELCYDSRHVNAQGVAVYTALLAKDVQNVLSATLAPRMEQRGSSR
jgi:hypothetical protein